MMSLPNVSSMSLSEYVDFIELRAIHLGVDVFDLNIEYGITVGVISDERYERAKCELLGRWAKEELFVVGH